MDELKHKASGFISGILEGVKLPTVQTSNEIGIDSKTKIFIGAALVGLFFIFKR
jgi:hypothetical protein